MTTPSMNQTLTVLIRNGEKLPGSYTEVSKSFNPTMIKRIMDDLGSIAEDTLNDLLKFVGFDQKEVFELATTNFNTSELTILIMLGLFKGTSALDPQKNGGKQWNTMSIHAQNFMNSIFEKVKVKGISFAVSGKGKVITIPRLIITFPNIAMGIMVKRGEDHFNIQMDIPFMFCFPGAAGMFPRNSHKEQFMQYVEWSKQVDRIINPTKTNPENVMRYANLGRDNGVMNDEERVRFMDYWQTEFFVTTRSKSGKEKQDKASVPLPSPSPSTTTTSTKNQGKHKNQN